MQTRVHITMFDPNAGPNSPHIVEHEFDSWSDAARYVQDLEDMGPSYLTITVFNRGSE